MEYPNCGYVLKRTKAEDAPLLEAAQAATAILNIPDDGRFRTCKKG